MSTVYSFDKISLLVDQRQITGFAEGSSIKIEDNEDSILPKVGVDGSVSYAGNANRSAKVTFTLAQTSASLPSLRRIAQTRGIFQLVVRDATADSGFLFSGENCAILKVPPTERGKEITGGEVSIFVPQPDYQE